MIVGPCTIVCGGESPAVIENGGVRVVGAHIAQMGPAESLAAAFPDDMLWPGRGRVLMPGYVNTHAHLAHQLARGLKLRGPREWRRYELALSPEDIRWGVTAALLEGVRHGVTTVCDFHRSGPLLDRSLTEVVDAARSVGVRVATCYGAAETDQRSERRAAAEESVRVADEITRRREGNVRGMIGVQASTLRGVEALLGETLEVAGERLAMHVDLALDSTPADPWRASSPWRETGIASVWAHAETAPRGLLTAAQSRGDMLSAVGSGAVAALGRDVEISWGSDAGINAPPLPDTPHAWGISLRAEMHYRRLLVNGPRWAARHFGAGLGLIASGSPADLLLVDYRPATEFSSRTLLEHLWCGLLRAPVSSVMVAGEIIMDNGVMVALDEREAAVRARECAKRVWRRLG